jgi:cytochrome c oxidase subunit IV
MNTAILLLRRQSRLIDGVWLFLAAATAITWLAGERGHGGLALVGFVFALALVKGGLVALEFMELRHAPALWRWIVLGWLLVVISFILLAYLNGLA